MQDSDRYIYVSAEEAKGRCVNLARSECECIEVERTPIHWQAQSQLKDNIYTCSSKKSGMTSGLYTLGQSYRKEIRENELVLGYEQFLFHLLGTGDQDTIDNYFRYKEVYSRPLHRSDLN